MSGYERHARCGANRCELGDADCPALDLPRSASLREAIEKLPRYIIVIQDEPGWIEGIGRPRDPFIHAAVKFDDLQALLDEHGKNA